MPLYTKFLDDLAPEDLAGERLREIVSAAEMELRAEHGDGSVSYRKKDGFEDGYFWVEVCLKTRAIPASAATTTH